MINGLPDRIKQQRMIAKMSQNDVANHLKVSKSIVSGYETGDRTPSVTSLMKLSRLFRCSVDYLLGLEGDSQRITLDITDLDPDERNVAFIIVDTLKRKK